MKQLMVGPVEVPEFVRQSMMQISISHRTEEYERYQKKIEENMKQVFGTAQPVFINTSSGTGSMETAIVNCFSKGEHVLVPVIGIFSQQFSDMCQAFGLDVEEIVFPEGESADPAIVESRIRKDTKGIFLTHNESATGVMNDLKAFGNLSRKHDLLLVVDSISGAGGLPIRMDENGIDVVLTASQKCLMSPAGLSFIALSEKAWKSTESSDLPRYYFDLRKIRSFNEFHQTPATPAVYTVFAVSSALEFMREQGFEAILQRTAQVAETLRKGVRELGLELFVKEKGIPSDTLTTILVPGKAKQIIGRLKDKGFQVAGGLGPYSEDMIRVGTMGYVFEDDIQGFLAALKEVAAQSA